MSKGLDMMNKKSKTKFILSLSVLSMIVIVAIITVVLINNNKIKVIHKSEPTTQDVADNDQNDYDEDKTEEATIKPEEETEDKPEPKPETQKKYNSLEKLAMAYESEEIDANEYFSQLLSVAYAPENIDSKYVSDYDFFISQSQLQLDDILSEHWDEIDEDAIKYYFGKLLLSDVRIGKYDTTGAGAEQMSYAKDNSVVTSLDYTIQTADNDQENAFNHTLDKVALSSNEHFLIWYTDTGDDAITEEQLKQIDDTLENAITIYTMEFGIRYSYDPYVDNKWFNDDYSHAEDVMEDCGLSKSYFKEAMSVYVYDTGSNAVLASYCDEQDTAKWINNTIFLDILDNDGIINYPYIILNRRGFEGNSDSLTQLCNHEFFHHMQFLYSMETMGERCGADLVISEGIANYASALASSVTSTGTFLNNWAGVYSQNTSTSLPKISDGQSKGYGIFPYFYAYGKEVPEAHDIIMRAHIEKDPFEYIQENTDKSYLVKTINRLAFSTISQDYDNKSMISNKGIKEKDELRINHTYNQTINPGAIDYYKLSDTMDMDLVTDGKDYVSFNVYGRLGNRWEKINSETGNMSIDMSADAHKPYDELYLAVTNGNLLDSYEYDIEIKETRYVENKDFVTSIDNYSMDITMTVGIYGIESTSKIAGVVDQKHQKQYFESSVSTFGMVVSNYIMYNDLESGYSYTYMTEPYDEGTWYKDKGVSQLVDLEKILDQLINMKNVEKIDDSHYKVKMSNSDISGLMSSADVDSSMITGSILVDVYVENGYIKMLDYDFSDLISGLDSLKTTIKFSNYNKAGDVNIPQSVVDKAMTR